MNNKAEALQNLSVPAFEVTNTPAADEAAQRLCMVPSRGCAVPLTCDGDIHETCGPSPSAGRDQSELLFQWVCRNIRADPQHQLFWSTKTDPEVGSGHPRRRRHHFYVWALQCFPVPVLEAPCHHPKPEAQLSLACFNGLTQHMPTLEHKKHSSPPQVFQYTLTSYKTPMS